VARRLEITAADHRIEIPAGERQARHDVHAGATGNELGERRGIERVDGPDALRESQRCKRVAPAAADLDV